MVGEVVDQALRPWGEDEEGQEIEWIITNISFSAAI